jgi:hypothetical protein
MTEYVYSMDAGGQFQDAESVIDDLREDDGEKL